MNLYGSFQGGYELKQTSPRLIQSVQRAIQIVECFDSHNKELQLSEISGKVGLNISTVHGILQTLLAYSYIDKAAESGKYKLGLKFLEKGVLVAEGLDLRDIGHPHLRTITEKYQETSHLCLLQQDDLYCIDKVESPHAYLIMSSKIGRTLPLHATASGKVILAYLPEEELQHVIGKMELTKLTRNTVASVEQLRQALKTIRQQGYSVEAEETELGSYCIATPVRNHKGRVIGSISLSGPVVRIKENEQGIITDLKERAEAISRELGYKAGQAFGSGPAPSAN